MRRLALLGLLLLGCNAPEGGDSTEPARIDPELHRIFDELKAAVDEGSDDVARALYSRLRPRCNDPLSISMAEGYYRILEGRSVRDAVQAQVVVREVEEGFALGLALSQGGSDSEVGYQRLSLTPGHVRIEWTAHSIDAIGRHSTQVGGRVLELPGRWVLTAGDVVEVPLGVDSPRIGEGLLAVRCEWRVSLGSGSAVVAKEQYPAQGLRVKGGSVVRLAKELPTGVVLPEELIRYALSEDVHLSALLERAVRISPESYAETIDLLEAKEAGFSPLMLQTMVPVLFWLTGTSGIEGSGEEWREWLRDRKAAREAVGNLDLPERGNR